MRQGGRVLVVGAALALSCNGPPKSAANGGNTALFLPIEGNRIKIEWAEGPGGQRSTRSSYDTQLKTECFWGRAADGEIRCLPRGLADPP